MRAAVTYMHFIVCFNPNVVVLLPALLVRRRSFGALRRPARTSRRPFGVELSSACVGERHSLLLGAVFLALRPGEPIQR